MSVLYAQSGKSDLLCNVTLICPIWALKIKAEAQPDCLTQNPHSLVQNKSDQPLCLSFI